MSPRSFLVLPVLIALCLMGGCTRHQPPTATSPAVPQTFEETINNVAIGMTVKELKRTMGQKPDIVVAAPDGSGMYGFKVDKDPSPAHPLYMVFIEQARVVSIYRFDGTAWNRRGGAGQWSAEAPSK